MSFTSTSNNNNNKPNIMEEKGGPSATPVNAGNAEERADSASTTDDTDTSEKSGDTSPVAMNVLHKTNTAASTISRASRRFEQINVGDREELVRLAREFSKDHLSASKSDKDDKSGADFHDPRLDPKSPEFDFYFVCQTVMQQLDIENIKHSRAGFTFKNLNVNGTGSAVKVQRTVGDLLFLPVRLDEYFNFRHKPAKKILQNFDGTVKNGEMLMVLGRPGSGCSTFLKVISGNLEGYNVDKDSVIHYNGIPQETMIKHFKGEVVYNQEVDKHFPHLQVGETLEFAAAVRTPHNRVLGVSRDRMIKYLTAVAMALFGLTHTKHTKVGDDFIRGVSGGERKRVSIAEMALARSPIACWDNSTRGLDSATAHQFIQALRTLTDVGGTCQSVSAYQASQAMYELFDKVIVLYEGRQIYFGSTRTAKSYFENMGWECPARQTTGDFLTSVTNPQERLAKEGAHVPTTPEDFEKYWKASPDFAALQREIQEHEEQFPIGGGTVQEFKEMHKAQQSKHIRSSSPYVVSVFMQIKLCIKRSYQRIWNDKASTLTHVIGQISMSLIIGSIFYGTANNTDAFFSKAAVIFFSVLLNALMAVTEINSLFAQRAIVEKHRSYAFYHPFTEAMAGYISDIPIKLLIATCFNIILYFLAGLRYDAGPFFIFYLFNFVAMLTMSGLFRAIAAGAKTISQAHSIAGVGVLALVIYTGFTIPRPYMHPWFKWISWINPIAYVFEAVLMNELHGQKYACSATSLVPPYPGVSGKEFTCAVAGAVAGQTWVSGDEYGKASYRYSYTHVWRNFGFIIAFLVFFLFLFLVITELNSSTTSTAEVLVFRRGHIPKYLQHANQPKKVKDVEAGVSRVSTVSTREVTMPAEQAADINIIPPQKDVFTWQDVTYDIPTRDGTRRLLDNVSGWVRPGTLTTLMGVSGAGKTTLLNVLAQRVPIGVVHGDMLVNGNPLPASFQRSTGYVQQQDLHLETSTVREALRFSAMLRQPKSVSNKEKHEYVEHVIDMLNMQEFAEAVVGIPGEGLNVEQRKLLTIGVELAAKPALLLFLDEPTSGLDSQSSWSIVSFLRKLADNGQAVLTTIHQPSAMLFGTFDRLLFLAKGGKTVYFGEIGQDAQTLFKYFESNGARPCGAAENPAEYILEIAGETKQDWPSIWKNSNEAKDVLKEIEHIKMTTKDIKSGAVGGNQEFAMPFTSQLWHCTIRVFQQYWRTPSYIAGKFSLGIASSLFIGFSFFQSNTSLQGLQNVILSIFMLTAIFGSLVQQIMPRFITQRSLYEVRERPSKAYSWAAFLVANIIVEIPYQLVLSIAVFGAYNYPIFGIQSSERQGLILIFVIQFFLFASTFAHLVIAALPDADTAGSIATLMFALIITFNGVMQPPSALPGFWIFLYRVSPFTYLVSGIISSALHNQPIRCSKAETAVFNPPQGMTCGAYLQKYLTEAPGYLVDMASTTTCEYCPATLADQYLAGRRITWTTRWRNVGLVWAYVAFNIFGAALMYYTFRVKRWNLRGFNADVLAGVKAFGKVARSGFGLFGVQHHS